MTDATLLDHISKQPRGRTSLKQLYKDFRLRGDGALYVLEANANPNISMAEDFAQSSLTAGLRYRDVLNRILQLGAAYPAAWRGVES